MRFEIEISEEAKRQLQHLPDALRRNIGRRHEQLRDGLRGDGKKLAGRESGYRLRVGAHRVLFTLQGNLIRVYAVRDRKDAYV